MSFVSYTQRGHPVQVSIGFSIWVTRDENRWANPTRCYFVFHGERFRCWIGITLVHDRLQPHKIIIIKIKEEKSKFRYFFWTGSRTRSKIRPWCPFSTWWRILLFLFGNFTQRRFEIEIKNCHANASLTNSEHARPLLFWRFLFCNIRSRCYEMESLSKRKHHFTDI